jgi:hypothetical protein
VGNMKQKCQKTWPFQIFRKLYPCPLFNQWTNFNKILKILVYDCKKICLNYGMCLSLHTQWFPCFSA